MAQFIAQHANGQPIFASDQPGDSPPARGLESCSSMGSAKRFSTEGEMIAWIEARGGNVSEWRALVLS